MLGVRGEGRSPSSADDTAIDNDALILLTFTPTLTTHSLSLPLSPPCVQPARKLSISSICSPFPSFLTILPHTHLHTCLIHLFYHRCSSRCKSPLCACATFVEADPCSPLPRSTDLEIESGKSPAHYGVLSWRRNEVLASTKGKGGSVFAHKCHQPHLPRKPNPIKT